MVFLLNKYKKKIISPINKYFSKTYSNLISSLIFGSKANPVDENIETNFRNLGLSHALAASGMQIVFIINICYLLTFFMKKNSIFQKIFISIPVIFYMFLTDMPASIIRAGFINLLILFLKKDNKIIDTFNTFLFGTLIIILITPLIIFDIGFQFSLLATFGLISLNPILNKKISFFIPSKISKIISIILSAQLLVLPLQIYYFQEFSIIFLVANIIASIFITLLTYLGILIILLDFMFPNLSYYLSLLTNFTLNIFIFITDILSYNFSILKVSKPYIFNVIFIYLLIVLIVLRTRKAFIFLFLTIFLISNLYLEYNNSKYLKVDFLYVGQGNSTFIQTPKGKNILIDCGSKIEFKENNNIITISSGKKTILPFLNRKGIKQIDILILTHPDNDHIGGCEDIINSINVKEVWDSNQLDESRVYSDLLSSILKNNINIKTNNLFYKENNFEIKAFNLGFKNTENSYNNNNSLIVDIKFLEKKFLLMSDVELEGEKKLINSNYNLKSDVLQVGHHGSKTSSSKEFLRKVIPEISIISCGKNNIYKHPNYEVLQKVKTFSNYVYRTDELGQISLLTDGKEINVKSQKNLF
ncbi:MAG: DNA internalization-related competence protein ComEC/Rec2 [Candidatus Sericytochromatia bacterium]|nr:MAG: DNA internalization-related competence protein ComEC/Rec2 [Candidatus Sericytochromatia bacterium]